MNNNEYSADSATLEKYEKQQKIATNSKQQLEDMEKLASVLLTQNDMFKIKNTIKECIKNDTRTTNKSKTTKNQKTLQTRPEWKHYYLYYFLFKCANKSQIKPLSSIYAQIQPACNNMLRNSLERRRNKTLEELKIKLPPLITP